MNIKVKWLKNQLANLKLDGMIITNPVNIMYLTGISEEGTLIITKRENIFITDGRYIESVNSKITIEDEIVVYNSKELDKYDYENIFTIDDNVGFEENYVTYENYKKYLHTYRVNLIETEGMLENQRIIKEQEELECIKKACEITDRSFEYIIKNIEEGMTEKEIAFEIQKFMIKNGADGLAFDLIVASGENSSKPHAVPTDREVRSGDIIQFDIGCKYKGFCSDLSRVVFMDRIEPEYKEIYDFVLNEQKRIANEFKDGANIRTVIKNIEEEYKSKNFSVAHAFGHGVGLEIHELPRLQAKTDNILKENSVIAIEPGVYIPGRFGIRIEDTFKINKMSCESLTKCTKNYVVI